MFVPVHIYNNLHDGKPYHVFKLYFPKQFPVLWLQLEPVG